MAVWQMAGLLPWWGRDAAGIYSVWRVSEGGVRVANSPFAPLAALTIGVCDVADRREWRFFIVLYK